MSKSYRKTPFIRQEKEDYRYLNRQIRRDKLAEIPNGGSYRKKASSWKNWNYIWTWEEAEKQYQGCYGQWWLQEKYTLEEWREYWERHAKRK